jgi:hypothetical protein
VIRFFLQPLLNSSRLQNALEMSTKLSFSTTLGLRWFGPQDAFRDKFLIQWHPESMRSMIPVSRPRVYSMIDFEVAVEFRPPAECVCAGGSFSEPEMYSRPPAPEMTTSEPYSPFKTDVWQLGIRF